MVLSVSLRLSVHNISFNYLYCFKYFLETCLICLLNGYSKKTYAVIWSVKVIHRGQSSNVNILCMRHTLNGLKCVHENKYIINISDNLQRKDI